MSWKTLQAMSQVLKWGRLQHRRLLMKSAVCIMLHPDSSMKSCHKKLFGSYCWSWEARGKRDIPGRETGEMLILITISWWWDAKSLSWIQGAHNLLLMQWPPNPISLNRVLLLGYEHCNRRLQSWPVPATRGQKGWGASPPAHSKE